MKDDGRREVVYLSLLLLGATIAVLLVVAVVNVLR